MVEIKKLLEAHKQAYADRQLSWGTKLSDYSLELSIETRNLAT